MKWKKNGTAQSVQDVFLKNIDAKNTDEVNGWFQKSYENNYRIDLIPDAVAFTKQYKNKRVTIIGDYDADGCTATAILYLALKWADFQDVRYRIPKRFSEGYGLNPVIIDEIETGLIITVDNGIGQFDAIQKAHDKGLKVIVLDHHLPSVDDKGYCRFRRL